MSKTHSSVQLEQELITEIRSVIGIIANWMAIPLFMLFWVADILYAPNLKWEFLAIRLAIVPLCFACVYFSKKINTLLNLQRLALAYAILIASGINIMIFLLNEPGTPYYAGLGLVAIGALSFIPFNKTQFITATIGIYLPYYLIVLPGASSNDTRSVLINSFFITSSICICFLVRFFHKELRMRDHDSKNRLQQEIINREMIIRQKTDEAVKLSYLSNQFSPQIIESIKNGKIDLDKMAGQRSLITAIFIDIVNSTERVTRIDKDKVDKVLSRFLENCAKVMLKYDITIDKFLGDGILGFCNAPLRRQDFVHRTVNAALEIKDLISQEQDFFEKNWQRQLEIRVGIAKGYANVGFYGSRKHFRSFTAIGPVVNLASRLCSAAQPDQILIDWDIFEDIQDDFSTEFMGKKTLKGFEQDIIHTYEVRQLTGEKNKLHGVEECPTCGGILSLETNPQGHFVLMCRDCCSVVEQNSLSNDKDKIAS